MPTEREWGTLTREVQEIRHDLRNSRMVIDSLVEDLGELKGDFQKMKTRIATSVAAVVVVAGVVAWALEMFVRPI
jgi:hypothetical protein